MLAPASCGCASYGIDCSHTGAHQICAVEVILGKEYEKTSSMCLANLKTHEMNTRDEESFDAKFAHTGRLQNSAIPYMQRLLNKDK